MIRFVCHYCHANVRAPDRKTGKWSRCPSCNTALQVPWVVLSCQAEPPPVRLPEEPLDEASKLPSSSWWIRWLLVGGLLAALAWACWVAPTVIHPEHQIIANYLVSHLHDPQGMEILRWSSAEPVHYGIAPNKKRGLFIIVSIRSKNGLGGRTITEHMFLIRDNQVIKTQQVGNTSQALGAPYSWDYNWALSQMEVEFDNAVSPVSHLD